jgi:hypothetical protein
MNFKLLESLILDDAKTGTEITTINSTEFLMEELGEKLSPKEISVYINKNLYKVGVETSTSLKDSVITINQENLDKIRYIANSTIANPQLNSKEIVKTVQLFENLKKNNIPVILKLNGIGAKYWTIKQFSYQAISGWHIYSMKNAAASSAAISLNGAAGLTIGSTMSMSFSLALFFALLESHVPTGRAKDVIRTIKVVSAVPILCTEYTANAIFGAVENVVFKTQFPTNITSHYGFLEGPEIEKIPEIKNAIGKFLIKMWKS